MIGLDGLVNQIAQQNFKYRKNIKWVFKKRCNPFFKNKGDIQNCASYRAMELTSHMMKLQERVAKSAHAGIKFLKQPGWASTR